MRVDPQLKLKNLFFYNNLFLIVSIFCIICFITSIILQNSYLSGRTDEVVTEGMLYGPINIKDKAKIYKVEATMMGNNVNSYISGEVLDKDKDTLYEFGKDLWHEEGYDSEGYWSEAERKMTAYLAFKEKGTYYIQFQTDENNMGLYSIDMKLVRGSSIAHLQVGSILIIIIMILFYLFNRAWVKEKMEAINEKLESASDD